MMHTFSVRTRYTSILEEILQAFDRFIAHEGPVSPAEVERNRNVGLAILKHPLISQDSFMNRTPVSPGFERTCDFEEDGTLPMSSCFDTILQRLLPSGSPLSNNDVRAGDLTLFLEVLNHPKLPVEVLNSLGCEKPKLTKAPPAAGPASGLPGLNGGGGPGSVNNFLTSVANMVRGAEIEIAAA